MHAVSGLEKLEIQIYSMAKLGGLMLNPTSAFIILLFLLSSNITFSQSIIKTLPGFPGDLPFKLETGYIGVGEKQGVQLFYYFVESERNPEDDPLVISNNGGPGCSALWAFLYQVGPLKFDYGKSIEGVPKLMLNSYAWTKVANVIFFDTIGAGFSYGETAENYKTSDTLSAVHLNEFLRKWLKIHPKYISNPLYVSGISYAGIVVPPLVQDIYNGNEAGNEPIINIKGYMLGNPLTDRNIDFNAKIPYAHRFALLSDELFESTKENCHGDYVNVLPSNKLCSNNLQEVDKCLEDINEHQILEPNCISETGRRSMLLQKDGSSPEENPLQLHQVPESWCRGENYEYAITWASDQTVQKALHIREGTITDWLMCNNDHYWLGRNDTATYAYDVSSSVGYHRNLTKKVCRALIFSGDHDMVFPYLGTRKWIHTLNLKVNKKWAPWFVKNQVAGYTETFSRDNYSLTYATVKGAGHSAPEYKPEQSLIMVNRWFNNHPL